MDKTNIKELQLHPYQQRAVSFIKATPRACLFLDMGLGKTAITLTAIKQLIAPADKVLIIAPAKVAESTWTDEVAKWDNFSALKIVRIIGTPAQRIKALKSDSNIYVLGRDNVAWLGEQSGTSTMFKIIVLDELTSFKNVSSIRYKAIRKFEAKRIIGLTGTPVPNGYIDLYGQVSAVDGDKHLGSNYYRWRSKHFIPFVIGGMFTKWSPMSTAGKDIYNEIKDICLTMKAKDYLDVPQSQEIDVFIDLSKKVRKAYDDFKRDLILSLPDGEVSAANAAVVTGKLCQITSGAVYTEEHDVQSIHTEKYQRIAEIVEAANGQGVLVFYQYKHERDGIAAALKSYRVSEYKGDETLNKWNKGQLDVILAHPASVSYGLNLQYGGKYVVWASTGFNYEQYVQGNARIVRQGQTARVKIYRIIARDTIDEQVLKAISGKKNNENILINYWQDERGKKSK